MGENNYNLKAGSIIFIVILVVTILLVVTNVSITGEYKFNDRRQSNVKFNPVSNFEFGDWVTYTPGSPEEDGCQVITLTRKGSTEQDIIFVGERELCPDICEGGGEPQLLSERENKDESMKIAKELFDKLKKEGKEDPEYVGICPNMCAQKELMDELEKNNGKDNNGRVAVGEAGTPREWLSDDDGGEPIEIPKTEPKQQDGAEKDFKNFNEGNRMTTSLSGGSGNIKVYANDDGSGKVIISRENKPETTIFQGREGGKNHDAKVEKFIGKILFKAMELDKKRTNVYVSKDDPDETYDIQCAEDSLNCSDGGDAIAIMRKILGEAFPGMSEEEINQMLSNPLLRNCVKDPDCRGKMTWVVNPKPNDGDGTPQVDIRVRSECIIPRNIEETGMPNPNGEGPDFCSEECPSQNKKLDTDNICKDKKDSKKKGSTKKGNLNPTVVCSGERSLIGECDGEFCDDEFGTGAGGDSAGTPGKRGGSEGGGNPDGERSGRRSFSS